MKTLQEVNREITSLAKKLEEVSLVPSEKRAASKLQIRIDQLRFFRLYLETNPRPESIEKMREDVQHRLKIYESRFLQWCAGQSEEPKVLKVRYNSAFGLSELKNKLKALNYLCE